MVKQPGILHCTVKAIKMTAGWLSFKGKSDLSFIIILLLIAFLVRMVWIIWVKPSPVCDFSFYYKQGILLSQGHGYTGPDGRPTAFWPVGYPAFLAILFYVFGPSLFVGKLANVILSVGTLAVFYWFAVLISKNKSTARLSTAIVALFPSQIAYCSLISDTILFQFLLYAGLFFLCRKTTSMSIFLAGTIFGLSVYVRPYALLVPLLFPLVYWRRLSAGKVLKFTAFIYLWISVVVLPWTFRNYLAFGGFALVSTNGGFNLLIGNNPHATGRFNNLKMDVSQYDNEFELHQATRRMALEYIISHPCRTIIKSIDKLYYMYNDDSNALWWNLAGYRYRNRDVPVQQFMEQDLPWVAVFQLYYLFCLFGTAGYVVRNSILKKQSCGVHPLGLCIILYFSLIAVVFFGDPRFHLPVNPLFALYASAFICSIVQQNRRKRI